MPIVKCEFCGKYFKKDSWGIRHSKHHYCSKECAVQAKRKLNTFFKAGKFYIMEVRKPNTDKMLAVLIDEQSKSKIENSYWGATYSDDIENYYIHTRIQDQQKRYHKIFLHRLLTNCPTGLTVDHINHNTLDNRLRNLKVCTQAENNYNKPFLQSNNKTGYRGISFYNRDCLYVVRLRIDKKDIVIGRFKTLEQAVETKHRYLKEKNIMIKNCFMGKYRQ